MANVKNTYDVIIIGGGPAGIATALTLGARGISHVIVEANLVPTRKLGEAIPPNAKPLLKKLGIQHLVEAKEHHPYYGNKSCWGNSALELKEFIAGIYGHGYLLDRLRFEEQLRMHVINQGSSFMAGYKFRKVERTNIGVEVSIQNENETQVLSAKYVVDATGRKASVCQQLGIKKQQLDNQFAMVCKATLEAPMPHQILVEATENGWWYVAPQKDNEIILLFFTDRDFLPEKKNTIAFIEAELKNTAHISKLLAFAVLDLEHLKIMPAGTSKLAKTFGDCWMAVGDAAYTFDPISSYGITSALASGYYAGHALASVFANKEDALLAYTYVLENAFQGYMEKLEAQYALENRWKESAFWKKRRTAMSINT
ncbi:NAD(P)/FAD-dependent oxidoreductase [Lacinutrix sp. MEBiC02595]